MSQDLGQPQILYRLDELLPESEQVKVAVLVAPDATEPFQYVPFFFDKTVHYLRSYELVGRVTIKDQELYASGAHSYGFFPITAVRDFIARTGVGHGVVTLRVIREPIFLLPDKERKSWDRDQREYYPIPQNFYRVDTPEQRAAFDALAEHRATFKRQADDWQVGVKLNKATTNIEWSDSKFTLYDSENSPEQNFADVGRILSENGVTFKEDDLREVVGLTTAE